MNLPQEAPRALGDAVSIGVVVGTLSDMLPAIAALMTVIWTMIRIWETDTIQRAIGRNPVAKAGDED
ncbi:hypothetical protein [Sphingomonas sp. IW22]|uniref:hypothetical protein n=1 Tax=Sphingomonas sp. IW22 TaxID=3242489 RepID=UPI003522472C